MSQDECRCCALSDTATCPHGKNELKLLTFSVASLM